PAGGATVQFTNAGALAIGTVAAQGLLFDGADGVSNSGPTAPGTITVVTQNGDLTVNRPVVNGSNVSLTVGGAESLLTNAANINSPVITLVSNRMALAGGTVKTGGGTVTLRPSTAGRPIDLGGATDPAGTLTLSAAELNTISANFVTIGD